MRPRVAQLAISAAAVAAVVWWAAHQPLPDLPSAGTALPAAAAALALYALATLLRGERWLALVRHDHVPLPRADAHGLTLVGYMGNNILPARAGDLMKAGLSARRAGAPAPALLGDLVAERMLDVAALALLFAVLVGTLDLPLGVPGWMLVAAGAALATAAGAAIVLGRRIAAAGRLRALAAALLGPTRRLGSVTGARLLGTSLVIWTVEGSVYAVLGHAAGIELSLLDGLYIMALANLVAMVPAAPGYVGTYDAAVLLALGFVTDGAQAAGLAYVALVRFVLFVPIAVAGLVALLTRYGGLGSLRRRERAATPVTA